MPLKNFQTVGELQDYEYLKGVITEVNSDNDTCSLTIGGTAHASVPIFYHCNPDVAERDNGALEGAAAAFAVDDQVVVLKNRDNDKIFVVAHVEDKKPCGGLMLVVFTHTIDADTREYVIYDVIADEIYAVNDPTTGMPLSQPFMVPPGVSEYKFIRGLVVNIGSPMGGLDATKTVYTYKNDTEEEETVTYYDNSGEVVEDWDCVYASCVDGSGEEQELYRCIKRRYYKIDASRRYGDVTSRRLIPVYTETYTGLDGYVDTERRTITSNGIITGPDRIAGFGFNSISSGTCGSTVLPPLAGQPEQYYDRNIESEYVYYLIGVIGFRENWTNNYKCKVWGARYIENGVKDIEGTYPDFFWRVDTITNHVVSKVAEIFDENGNTVDSMAWDDDYLADDFVDVYGHPGTRNNPSVIRSAQNFSNSCDIVWFYSCKVLKPIAGNSDIGIYDATHGQYVDDGIYYCKLLYQRNISNIETNGYNVDNFQSVSFDRILSLFNIQSETIIENTKKDGLNTGIPCISIDHIRTDN